MELVSQTGTVNQVTSEQLREYTGQHHERDYVIIDVRQPEEYGQGHIPGAHLLPLGELEMRANELGPFAERTVVFYCRSGARSGRASDWVVRQALLPKVANLLGGFSGWQGLSLPDFPRLKVFDKKGTVEALLRQGLELEKGTYLLYGYLASRLGSGPAADIIGGLAKAEMAHARSVYRLLPQAASNDFDSTFEQLPGDLVESGQPFAAVVARARELEEFGPPALLELALEIELSAYDLYKALAVTVTADDAKAVLTDLAQQEKQHSESVLKALGAWAASRLA